MTSDFVKAVIQKVVRYDRVEMYPHYCHSFAGIDCGIDYEPDDCKSYTFRGVKIAPVHNPNVPDNAVFPLTANRRGVSTICLLTDLEEGETMVDINFLVSDILYPHLNEIVLDACGLGKHVVYPSWARPIDTLVVAANIPLYNICMYAGSYMYSYQGSTESIMKSAHNIRAIIDLRRFTIGPTRANYYGIGVQAEFSLLDAPDTLECIVVRCVDGRPPGGFVEGGSEWNCQQIISKPSPKGVPHPNLWWILWRDNVMQRVQSRTAVFHDELLAHVASM